MYRIFFSIMVNFISFIMNPANKATLRVLFLQKTTQTIDCISKQHYFVHLSTFKMDDVNIYIFFGLHIHQTTVLKTFNSQHLNILQVIPKILEIHHSSIIQYAFYYRHYYSKFLHIN